MFPWGSPYLSWAIAGKEKNLPMNHFRLFETLNFKYTVYLIYRSAVVKIYDPFSVLASRCYGSISHSLFRDSSSAGKVNKL